MASNEWVELSSIVIIKCKFTIIIVTVILIMLWLEVEYDRLIVTIVGRLFLYISYILEECAIKKVVIDIIFIAIFYLWLLYFDAIIDIISLFIQL